MRHHRHLALRESAPPLDVGALAAHLWTGCLVLLGGIAAGFALIAIMRWRGLRWTWALLGFPLAYVLTEFDWPLAAAVGIAGATATALGIYWRVEDHYRGGETARRAREDVGPLHLARNRLGRRRIARQRVEPARKRLLGGASEPRLALGLNRRGTAVHIPIGIEDAVHALVVGATGAGKTVTQAAIAQTYILAGLPAIVIDPKGDPDLRAALEAAARRMGVRFREWSPDGSTVYNPLARGSVTEIADKALAGHEWSEPHYELAIQRLLQHVLPTMREAGFWPPTLLSLSRYMDPERLDSLAAGAGGEIADRVAAYVDELSERAKADLAGGRNRLAVLAEGDLGHLLDPACGHGEEIDLARALRECEVVYFHIDADRYPASSKLLAAALVIDLVGLTADLQGGQTRGLLVIDEFAALAADQVSRLFGRARSAGLSLLLGTQTLADLRSARPDDPNDTLTEQILSNVGCAIVHREADPDSAERLARMAGTYESWSTTERVGGRSPEGVFERREGTRTRAREFVLLPDEIKRLGVGEAALIAPTQETNGEIVRVFRPRELDGR